MVMEPSTGVHDQQAQGPASRCSPGSRHRTEACKSIHSAAGTATCLQMRARDQVWYRGGWRGSQPAQVPPQVGQPAPLVGAGIEDQADSGGSQLALVGRGGLQAGQAQHLLHQNAPHAA